MFKKAGFLVLLVLLTACTLPSIEDRTAPAIAVIYPYEGAVISADISVQVMAADNDKIKKVWFYVDGEQIAESTESPYSMPFAIAGYEKKVDHVLEAAVEDKSGNIAFSNTVSFVIADTDDIIPPTVEIVNPQGGQVVEGIVNVTAYAEDERSIQRVDFFIDGIEAGSTSAYPYIYNWDTSTISDSTSHTLFARAVDGGNNETISPVVQVTVYPRTGEAGDNTAPNALFLYPITAATLSGQVEVSVDVADNEKVTKAKFYVDGQLNTSADNPSSPWIFTWDTTPKADGNTHSLYVKVYDAAGNAGTTGLMVVTIQ